jgi:flagellar basal body-associated protein FliL
LPQETIPGQCSSKDLFDFNCYKNLKILLWFLLILITIVIIAFFLYLVNKLVRINNDTPTTKTIKSSSQTGIYYNTPQTVRLEKVNSSPEPKPFLSRLFGFKDDSVDSKSKSSSRKKK